MEEIMQYIKEHKLDARDRYRPLVYKRYYFYNLLRLQGMTYKQIGDIFDKDHVSIMHGIKTHKMFTEMNDNIYYECTEMERLKFEQLSPEYDLIEDINNCYSFDMLKKIKFRLRNNLYKYLPLQPHLDDGEEM